MCIVLPLEAHRLGLAEVHLCTQGHACPWVGALGTALQYGAVVWCCDVVL